jgi:hypothetical protein
MQPVKDTVETEAEAASAPTVPVLGSSPSDEVATVTRGCGARLSADTRRAAPGALIETGDVEGRAARRHGSAKAGATDEAPPNLGR